MQPRRLNAAFTCDTIVRTIHPSPYVRIIARAVNLRVQRAFILTNQIILVRWILLYRYEITNLRYRIFIVEYRTMYILADTLFDTTRFRYAMYFTLEKYRHLDKFEVFRYNFILRQHKVSKRET